MQKLLSNFQDCLDVLKIKAPKNLTPKIKADIIFRAACKIQRIDPKILPLQKGILTRFGVGNIAQYKLEIIVAAVVGKWKQNWDGWEEKKWFPYYWMNKPGFRFLVTGYVNAFSSTAGGSRLCFKTSEQARWIGIDCIWLYKELMNAPALAPEAIKALSIAA